MFDKVTVATFSQRKEAEDALRVLEHDGVPLDKMSIVAVNPYQEDHALRYFGPGERVLNWATWAALSGALWGMIFGPLFVHIPFYGNLPGIVHGHFFAFHVAANPWAILWGPGIDGLVFGLIAALIALVSGLSMPKRAVIKNRFFLQQDICSF